MDRRTFLSILAAGAASSLWPAPGTAQPAPGVRNVVLVHGLFADGSCWSDVIARLQPKGFQVTAVQNPLTSLRAAVEETQRVLGVIPNFYVTYVPDAPPLTRKQKYSLAWKSSIDPVTNVPGLSEYDDRT